MGSISVDGVMSALGNWQTLFFFFIVLVGGLIGGVAQYLAATYQERVIGETSTGGQSSSLSQFRVGFFIKSAVIGVAAALAILFVFLDSPFWRLVSISVIAGYGGISILNSLKAKFEKIIAEKGEQEEKKNTEIDAELLEKEKKKLEDRVKTITSDGDTRADKSVDELNRMIGGLETIIDRMEKRVE